MKLMGKIKRQSTLNKACFRKYAKCLRISFRALRGNEIMQLRKIHAFFLLSRHLVAFPLVRHYLGER